MPGRYSEPLAWRVKDALRVLMAFLRHAADPTENRISSSRRRTQFPLPRAFQYHAAILDEQGPCVCRSRSARHDKGNEIVVSDFWPIPSRHVTTIISSY